MHEWKRLAHMVDYIKAIKPGIWPKKVMSWKIKGVAYATDVHDYQYKIPLDF